MTVLASPARMEFRILGSLEALHEGRELALGGSKQRALLLLLLLHANETLTTDRLIDELWGERPPIAPAKTVQVHISRLRKALAVGAGNGADSVVLTREGGYELAIDPERLDAHRFERLVADGRSELAAGRPELAAEALERALSLWRGSCLVDFAYAPFAQREIARLDDLRAAALELLIEAKLALGGHAAVVGQLEALIAEYPYRERLRALLMLALYRSDRQADALQAYQDARKQLVEELGIEPGERLRELERAILAQDAALVAAAMASATGDDGGASSPAADLPSGVVTFLLTDIEGSSGLWEADAPAMAAALELHDALIAGVVEAHGGRLLKAKGEGDATLTVFRRASDAVACAVELQGALRGAAWPGGLDLRVRVALHTGEAHERAGDFFGPALNRAARLRGLAHGGAIVLSGVTAEIVRERLPAEVELVERGRHQLRGLSRPENVFELRQLHEAILTHAPGPAPPDRPSADRSPLPASLTMPIPRALMSLADSPFVAREPELARLLELWGEASAGGRVAVLVAGEAGIGKTRLAAELARVVDGMGGLVLYGRCDQDLAVPYQPFVEALRPIVRAMGPDRLKDDLGGLAAELPRLLPELGALGKPTRADPETERFAMFEAVSALSEAVTDGRPALFVLEDLHWAAAPTLLLMRHLIRSERPQRALLLGTYRDTELDIEEPLARLIADLERDASAEKLNIAGLDEAAIASLLEAASQAAGGRTAELAHLLQIETGGNPFFIRELLAHLNESGAIDGRGEQGADLVPSLLEVPEGLRHVIRQRVARQSETSQRTLSFAAIAGPSFSLTILERVLEGESGVLDALDEATAAGLLTETGPDHYAFAHALVRQAIYAGLSSARRMRMHRRVGEALEALGDRESHIEALAHHFAEAAADGQAHKAAAYALAAGRSATARLAYEDATAHYHRGLQALAPQSDDRQRCELLLALGEAQWRTEDLADAREACFQAGVLAERLGLATVQARAALGVAGPVRLEVPTAATEPVVAVMERALAALPEEESALRARLMARLAAVVAFSRPEQRRPALAREALDIARRAGDKAALAEVLDASTWALTGPDALDERMDMLRELARLATELGDISLRASAHEAMHDELLAQGDVEASERELEAREQLPQAQRRRSPRWWAALARARRAYLDGQLDRCEELAHDALRLGLNELEAAQAFQAQMFAVRREQGRLEELVDAVQGTVAERPEFAAWRAALAYTYAELDRPADARRELETLAQGAFSDLPRDGFWAMNMSLLSHVVALLDDVPRAKVFYELLLPYGGRCVVAFTTVCLGSASRPLGLLAATMSRYEQAARHFEDALEMNTRIRSPLWIAHTQHEYARMLLRDRRGDRRKALALLGEALAAAERLGLKALADRARPLRRQTGDPASA